MKTYWFTLHLTKITMHIDSIEDALFEAGCDDALLGFEDNTPFLDFHREASSLDEAVSSAMENVRSAGIGAEVIRITSDDDTNTDDYGTNPQLNNLLNRRQTRVSV